MQIISSPPPVTAEVQVNENFDTLDWAATFGRRHPVTTGLTWGWWGGRWGGAAIADGQVTLAASATSYLVVDRATGAVSASTSTANWNDRAAFGRLYLLTTSASAVTAVEDHRCGPGGALSGLPRERRVVPVSAAYACTLADAETCLLHPSADTTARTWTIPANASVAYPVGTELEMVNQNAAGAITIAITTDTMRLAGSGATGNRTLAANGLARAKKLAATEWLISGWGLT